MLRLEFGSAMASPATCPSKAGPKKAMCPICDTLIRDSVARQAGQDAVECSGSCSAWIHKHCAGLSKVAFQAVRIWEALLLPSVQTG